MLVRDYVKTLGYDEQYKKLFKIYPKNEPYKELFFF